MPNNKIYKDEELVKKAREGDHRAFSELILRYKDKSLALACSIIKDNEKAEDVLQDAFIKVYRNLKNFRLKSKFSTWLYRIVVNTAYNSLKKIKKYERNVRIEDGHWTEVDDGFIDSLLLSDQKHFINLALDKLIEDESLALRLFYLCEMSIKEIETISGFSKSKIKVDLHRGRSNFQFQLKQLLGKELNNLL